jgi:hypothetical protein
MNLCKRKGEREVVEEDKTQKAGELKSEAWRGLEENECWGKCEIVEAYLQGQNSWTNEGARSGCPEIEKSRRNFSACAIP